MCLHALRSAVDGRLTQRLAAQLKQAEKDRPETFRRVYQALTVLGDVAYCVNTPVLDVLEQVRTLPCSPACSAEAALHSQATQLCSPATVAAVSSAGGPACIHALDSASSLLPSRCTTGALLS